MASPDFRLSAKYGNWLWMLNSIRISEFSVLENWKEIRLEIDLSIENEQKKPGNLLKIEHVPDKNLKKELKGFVDLLLVHFLTRHS